MELPSRETIANQVRTLQIILAALIAGCLVFAPIAVFMKPDPDPANEESVLVVTSMALAFGAFALVAQFVIGPMLRRQSRQAIVNQEGTSPDDPQRLLAGYQTSAIVSAAFAEGACFFNLIAHLIEGSPYTLLMAAVLVVSIVFRFPTVDGVTDWLQREMRLVQEERGMGRR